MGSPDVKRSYYALQPGGWRDYVTVLHLPYTLWNLSYVTLGAALAPQFHVDRLLLALAAFALALGVSAHALDEVNGRPLHTQIPTRILVGLATAALIGACAIGVVAAAAWGWWLLAFVVVGAVIVPGYNLELAGGILHNDLGLALAWGAFPILTGYFVEAQTVRLEAVLAAGYGAVLIMAQRTLSTQAREARRVRGAPAEAAPYERALRLMGAAAMLLACAAVATRLT
jgi:hypothetical protein